VLISHNLITNSNPKPRPDPKPNPNCIACIFSKVTNWGCLGLPLRRSGSPKIHIFISKLLTTVSQISLFINLVTFVLLNNCWGICGGAFLKWPPCSQTAHFLLRQAIVQLRLNCNYSFKSSHIFFADLYFTRLEEFVLACAPSYPLNIFAQIFYTFVFQFNFYMLPESEVA